MPYSTWRELAARNRAVIEQAGIPTGAWTPAAHRLWCAPGQPPAATPRVDWQALLADGLPAIKGGGPTLEVGGGVRRALVHVPAGLDPGTRVPLVCMLHGCTQDAASFAAATLMNDAADRHGFVVVYPEQERGDNPMACWNWFLSGHQARDAGEPAEIAGIVRELSATTEDWTIDSDRVFVAGLSSGGAMAAILGATYPDLFAAVAVHSGLAYGSATDMQTAFSAMANGAENPRLQGRDAYAAMGEHARPVPTMVIHGNADRRVAPVNAEQVLQVSMAANRLADGASCDLDIARPSTTLTGFVVGGHGYTVSSWTDRHGAPMHELWTIDGLGHAWSGGAHGGSYADPRGPDAAEAIWRFFAQATANRGA
jgi:poly(hydroxyalkanoate) depolymerase family esterase